jgi:nitrate/nitrite-specific signal transduction histidine kinase
MDTKRAKLKKNIRKLLRLSIDKKLVICFAVLAAALWACLYIFESWAAAAAATVCVAAFFFIMVRHMIVRPLQMLTLSVIESRHTSKGFEYNPPDIHTGDELELLADAFKRMADDINTKSENGK